MHFYELLEEYLVNKNSFYCGRLVYGKSNHFPGSSDGKASAYNAGDPGLIPGLGRSPEGGHDNPVFLPGESHEQRSLAGYSPWSHKESDTSKTT